MIHFRRIARFIFVLFIGMPAFLRPDPALAYVLPLPASLAQETLSESVPTAFAPAEFTTADFEVVWSGPGRGPDLAIEEGSLQWVRVAEVLVLPRARLRISSRSAQEGRGSYAGFSQPLAPNPAGGIQAKLPIALLSGPEFPIEISLLEAGKELKGRAWIRFRPSEKRDFALIDPSCSRFGLEVQAFRQSEGAPRWAYLGCRQQITEAGAHRSASLELYVFWDQAGKSIRVGGVGTDATIPALWALRLRSAPGPIRLEAGEGRDGTGLSVRYAVAENLNLGFLGVGIGPYSYHFDGLGSNVTNLSPILTLYGSYFITETTRLVAFDATALSQHGSTDFGIYLSSENFRIIDRRLSINFHLGGHALAFAVDGQTYLIPGAPQGIEMIYTDAFRPGYNLSLGGFVYPAISGKAYYNVWVRWGSRIFAEVNYIAWEERIQEQRVFSRSLGLTVGLPVARFF